MFENFKIDHLMKIVNCKLSIVMAESNKHCFLFENFKIDHLMKIVNCKLSIVI